MSVDQYQRVVNTLDKEIADLEKKKANKEKEYASLQGKISTTNRSITKSTSESILRSKLRQISQWESDAAKKSSESAEIAVKIADKRKKRTEAYLRLQKAEQEEQIKTNRQNQRMISRYEKRIDELQRQLVEQIVPPQSTLGTINDAEYDLFVSHAFEDKEEIVDELVTAFNKAGLKVWYDTGRLKIGDSMREKIDQGLRKSRYGVVVLSPNYIAENKYWTKTELNGLFQRETINGKTILPIWHNLTKRQVVDYSPIIADRKALTTAQYTAEEIAQEIKELFLENETLGAEDGQAESAACE